MYRGRVKIAAVGEPNSWETNHYYVHAGNLQGGAFGLYTGGYSTDLRNHPRALSFPLAASPWSVLKDKDNLTQLRVSLHQLKRWIKNLLHQGKNVVIDQHIFQLGPKYPEAQFCRKEIERTLEEILLLNDTQNSVA